jgi:hypothetical protein
MALIVSGGGGILPEAARASVIDRTGIIVTPPRAAKPRESWYNNPSIAAVSAANTCQERVTAGWDPGIHWVYKFQLPRCIASPLQDRHIPAERPRLETQLPQQQLNLNMLKYSSFTLTVTCSPSC